MITIKDIARNLIAKHQINTSDAEIFIQQMVEVINDGLIRDRQVKIKGFGTFKVQTMKERSSINVNTGERVTIGEHDKITFTPDNTMKDLINKPFSQFETVMVSDDSPLLNGDYEVDLENEEEEETEPAQLVAEKPLPVVDVEQSSVSESEQETPAVEVEPEIPVVVEPELPAHAVEVEPAPVIVEPASAVVETTAAAVEQLKAPIAEETATTVSEPEAVEDSPHEKISFEENVATESSWVITGQKDEEADEDDSTLSNNGDSCNKQFLRCRNIFIYYGILINIVVAIIAFAIGYLFADYHTDSDAPKQDDTVVVIDDNKTEQIPAAPVVKKQQHDEQKKVQETEKTVETEKDVEVKVQVPDVKQEISKPSDVNAEKVTAKKEETEKKQVPLTGYDSDVRVRTGAYYIMGTDMEVKVQQGQTLKSISRTYLGPDMECYVEAYNNKKDVKPGDKVKIPLLKLKKIVNKQNAKK